LHFNDAIRCLDVVISGFHETIGVFERPTRAQRKAALKWLVRFDLGDYAETPLFGLSAGHQRMALLARALVKRPRLLILDEPCQGLDTVHRELFLRTVDSLIRAQEVTAIYVTHQPDEIPPSISRVLHLRSGQFESHPGLLQS
jgi:molybdate transport system ATP-binding protein